MLYAQFAYLLQQLVLLRFLLLLSRLKSLPASCERKNEAPMALINGTKRGALRSGLYAMRSTSKATQVEMNMPNSKMRSKAR